MSKIKKLGEIIRKTRKEQGLLQVELAAMSGVGVRFLRELEQGKESCHIGKAFTIIAMLGLEIQIGEQTL